MKLRTWDYWEAEVNADLNLSPTVGSGSKAHDPGDGTDRRHHHETDYAIQADAKFTERSGFSLNGKLLGQWIDRALAQGKRFVLPVRIWSPTANAPLDLAVVPYQDYLALVEAFRTLEEHEREGRIL
ncbi:Holliday junction resolvase [Mycobacterium phage Tonenili]|uniref:Holliday junction resolvase n=1 Tax=Mycobacterium phage Tonenili TaxID=1891703 RepID=A0A1C9EHI1_9CAUD|nr:Holliday junction resolvase [Mycobacterium phage Tonenili]AON96954.1 hypothetical protein SEA_TONENILI_234 [Mycobacterium phage Tonenili]